MAATDMWRLFLGCGRSWIPGRKSVIIGRKGALSTTDDIRCSAAVLDQRLIGELARMKSRQLGIYKQVYLHNNETLWFFACFCLWPLARLYRGAPTSCRFTGLEACSHPTHWGPSYLWKEMFATRQCRNGQRCGRKWRCDATWSK